MAFLVLLESLAPAERAVFLLREVFGYDYSEIADVTGKTEAACRQTFARARRRIDEGRPRFETSRAEGEELTSLFLAAADGGDMTSLLERLAPDVLFYGDSGGQGEMTFIAPVFGRDQVAELIRLQVERTLRAGRLAPRRLGKRAAGRAGLRRRRRPDRGHRVRRARRPGAGHPGGRQPGEAAPPRPGLAHLAPALARPARRSRDEED